MQDKQENKQQKIKQGTRESFFRAVLKVLEVLAIGFVIAMWGYSLCLLVIGLWGLSEILESWGVYTLLIYLILGLTMLLSLSFVIAIGAVYWLVNIWDWNLFLAILFVMPFGLLFFFLFIGKGFLSLFLSLFGSVKNFLIKK